MPEASMPFSLGKPKRYFRSILCSKASFVKLCCFNIIRMEFNTKNLVSQQWKDIYRMPKQYNNNLQRQYIID